MARWGAGGGKVLPMAANLSDQAQSLLIGLAVLGVAAATVALVVAVSALRGGRRAERIARAAWELAGAAHVQNTGPAASDEEENENEPHVSYGPAPSPSNFPADPTSPPQSAGEVEQQEEPPPPSLHRESRSRGTPLPDPSDSDLRSRLEAIDRARGEPAAEELLVTSLLGDDFPLVRRRAVQVLAARGGHRATAALIRAAREDPSTEVREEAVESLSHLLSEGHLER
jgi:HEAT repeats